MHVATPPSRCHPFPPRPGVQAVRHGVAKALQFFDPENRTALKTAGLLTRDARIVERKKPGRCGGGGRLGSCGCRCSAGPAISWHRSASPRWHGKTSPAGRRPARHSNGSSGSGAGRRGRPGPDAGPGPPAGLGRAMEQAWHVPELAWTGFAMPTPTTGSQASRFCAAVHCDGPVISDTSPALSVQSRGDHGIAFHEQPYCALGGPGPGACRAAPASTQHRRALHEAGTHFKVWHVRCRCTMSAPGPDRRWHCGTVARFPDWGGAPGGWITRLQPCQTSGCQERSMAAMQLASHIASRPTSPASIRVGALRTQQTSRRGAVVRAGAAPIAQSPQWQALRDHTEEIQSLCVRVPACL